MTTQTLRRPLTITLVLVGAMLAAFALALAPQSSAEAHDSLVDADPGPDSTATSQLSAVTLTFSDDVLSISDTGSSSIVQVTDADGQHYETSCAANQGRQVTAPVALGEAGKYTVAYQVVSADGHPVSNSYQFTYDPPEGAPAAKGTASSLCGATAGDSAPADSDSGADAGDADQPQSGSADPTTMLTIMIVIFVVIIAGVSLTIMFIRGKARGDDASGERNGGRGERNGGRGERNDGRRGGDGGR